VSDILDTLTTLNFSHVLRLTCVECWSASTKLSKDIGLFPQTSKIEIHKVQDIESELKSVSRPTEESVKAKAVDQQKLRKRIVALSKGHKVHRQRDSSTSLHMPRPIRPSQTVSGASMPDTPICIQA